MDCVIKLIAIRYEKDTYGVDRPIESEREVFAQVRSVTRQEFFDGGRNGLNPSLEFTVFFGDYAGETIIEFNSNRYSVYRTYFSDDDYIELYVERKGGTNGEKTRQID